MWQEKLAPHVESGALVVVGVVQEQHPDRARLYKQWRELDWPLFVDALNLLGHQVVPIPMGLSPSGQIAWPRMRLQDLRAFLNKDWSGDRGLPKVSPEPVLKGDAAFHAGELDVAVAAYGERTDAVGLFRLGVVLRRRYESDARRPTDAQAAVEAWNRALRLNPRQYIWRRRIQQYGPRLDKPYDFYGWVEQARTDIRARGEEPVPLSDEPRGAELLDPKASVMTAQLTDPDPEGALPRDTAALVRIEPAVTPAFVQPGHRVRVRLVFRPGDAFWNNEAEPLRCHVAAGDGVDIGEGLFAHPNLKEAETREPRVMEFELQVAADAAAGKRTVKGYALYNVCEKEGGTCRLLRQDFAIPVRVDPKAPRIQ